MKAILLDIEGTTTPIDFVHKTLFPFAKERIAKYTEDNFGQMRNEIAQLKAEHAEDTSYTAGFDETSPTSVSDYLRFLIDVDRKSTPLKSLQGKIWQQGYETGELLSEVFDDVPRAFERWKAAGKIVAIYSSGSVLAQQLLFRHTNHGDLTPYISNYFDTNVGGKREAESYRQIAHDINVNSETILFVSDIVSEIDAARACKFQTALSIRKGNVPILQMHSHTGIQNFDELP